MQLEALKTFLNKVELMNTLTNKGNRTVIDDKWYEAVKNQALRVLEEAQEIVDGCDNKCLKEVLDGVVDTQVTALPLIDMLEAVKFDVTGAMIEIAYNNLTKVVTDRKIAEQTIEQKFSYDTHYIDEVKYDGTTFYSVKRKSDDKYEKPVGYKSPDISMYVPEVKEDK